MNTEHLLSEGNPQVVYVPVPVERLDAVYRALADSAPSAEITQLSSLPDEPEVDTGEPDPDSDFLAIRQDDMDQSLLGGFASGLFSFKPRIYRVNGEPENPEFVVTHNKDGEPVYLMPTEIEQRMIADEEEDWEPVEEEQEPEELSDIERHRRRMRGVQALLEDCGVRRRRILHHIASDELLEDDGVPVRMAWAAEVRAKVGQDEHGFAGSMGNISKAATRLGVDVPFTKTWNARNGALYRMDEAVAQHIRDRVDEDGLLYEAEPNGDDQ